MFLGIVVFAAVGLALSLIGLVWMLVEAFSLGSGWGIAVLLGNVFGAIAFFFAYPRQAWRPLSVGIGGLAALVWSAVQQV